jgi:hypothetical protein
MSRASRIERDLRWYHEHADTPPTRLHARAPLLRSVRTSRPDEDNGAPTRR